MKCELVAKKRLYTVEDIKCLKKMKPQWKKIKKLGPANNCCVCVYRIKGVKYSRKQLNPVNFLGGVLIVSRLNNFPLRNRKRFFIKNSKFLV